ncbi:MAG: HK97 family phage prohead protease [Pseudomonadota bacterium]
MTGHNQASCKAAPLIARDLNARNSQTRIDDSGYFSGYASIFSVRDTGGDIVEPGAFKASLRGRKPNDIRLLWQHDPREPIGVISALREDDKGLFVEGQLLLEIERAKALYLLIKAGALDGLSIGYKVRKAYSDQAARARRLKHVDLWEVSFVTFPMQPMARLAQVKTLPTSIREYEAFLRDAGGFSRSQAAVLASKGFRGLAACASDAAAWEDVLHTIKSLTQDMSNSSQ